MPRGHIVTALKTAEKSRQIPRLLSELESEWKKPSDAKEPVIIEEPSGLGDYKRIYVIWSLWKDLSQRDRVEIILKAYENTHTLEEVQHITIGMGLTPREAADRNIRYELE